MLRSAQSSFSVLRMALMFTLLGMVLPAAAAGNDAAAAPAAATATPSGAKAPATPAKATSGAKLKLEKVVFALKPDKNPDAMLEERKALSAWLSKRLGRPVEVIVPLSSGVILEGMAGGTVDLGFVSGMDMINARKSDLATILLAVDFGGQNWYQSYWLTLKSKPYGSVAELKGKPIAFASKTSTSGYLVPHADMVKKGLLKQAQDPEEFFGKGNVFYGTGYVSAVEQLLQGRAEAAAVSDYVMDTDKYLSAEQKANLKVLQKQGPVPTHAIAVRTTVSAGDRQLLRAALEELNKPEHNALRDKLFNSALSTVKSDEDHLKSLREALQLTGKTQP